MTDPFDTAGLRAAVLAGWASSPTRLQEDAAAEADLVEGGYRDRLITELAQNAADAAARAGVPGALWIRVEDGRLHVANVGAPLDVSGVHALSSLRASGKFGAAATGRYGVGFTATVAVGDRIEFRSTSGSVVFDAEATAAELASAGISTDAVRGRPPVLRLPFPLEASPASGWDSEIVVTARYGVDPLPGAVADEAVDLLLELPALSSITVEDRVITRTTDGAQVMIDGRTWHQWSTARARWLVPVVDGRLRPVLHEVLRAPTRSDEPLTLPTLVITTDLDLAPDRRRVMPGADVGGLARGYATGVVDVAAGDRPALVPTPQIPAGAVDAALRQAVLDDLAVSSWVPTVRGPSVRPSEAVVIVGADDAVGRALVDAIPALVDPAFAEAATESTCTGVGLVRIGWAEVAARVAGQHRGPSWWYALYCALDRVLVGAVDLDEVAALPVPLTDGRTVTGPRTVVFTDRGAEIGKAPWARVVHPDAMHPLLSRLGATEARPADLLVDPGLAALLADPDAVTPDLVDDVLTLAGAAASPDGTAVDGLAQLPLRDGAGELRPADELLLPDSPLASVLVPDHPFGVVAPDTVAAYGAAALRTVGVGWGFTVVVDEHPVAPDHDLPDEDLWWDARPDEPESLVAVRDLDLVDDDAWPRALSMLLADRVTAGPLADRDGYTAWWLRSFARIDGTPLGRRRAPGPSVFEGILPVLAHPDAARLASVLACDRIDSVDLAAEVLARLGDPSIAMTAATAMRAHGLLADAVVADLVDLADLDAPDRVRAVDGDVCAAEDAVILDEPCLALVLDPATVVAGPPDRDRLTALAELLDLPCASEKLRSTVVGTGRASTVGEFALAAVAAAALGIDAAHRALVVHDRLRVQCEGIVTGVYEVPFWVHGNTMHVQGRWSREVR